MKKLLNILLIAQLVISLAGCCCPCGKNTADSPAEQETFEE